MLQCWLSLGPCSHVTTTVTQLIGGEQSERLAPPPYGMHASCASVQNLMVPLMTV
jgi:hypothetical protein